MGMITPVTVQEGSFVMDTGAQTVNEKPFMRVAEFYEMRECMTDEEIALVMLDRSGAQYHQTSVGIIVTPKLVPGWWLEFDQYGRFVKLRHSNYKGLNISKNDLNYSSYHIQKEALGYNIYDTILYMTAHDSGRVYSKWTKPRERAIASMHRKPDKRATH